MEERPSIYQFRSMIERPDEPISAHVAKQGLKKNLTPQVLTKPNVAILQNTDFQGQTFQSQQIE